VREVNLRLFSGRGLIVATAVFWAALTAASAVPAEGGRDGGSDSLKGKIFQQSRPIDIKSDTLKVFHRERYGLFNGHVSADRGDVKLFCDRLRADYDEKGLVEMLTCDGSARVVMGPKEASGDKAVFDNNRELVTITGSPSLRDGEDIMKGEIIYFNLGDDTVRIEKPQGVYRMKAKDEKKK
jgi:lipopolysaccharide transport protein LptA